MEAGFMEEQYHPQEIELEAQQFWDENQTFSAEENPDKEKES